MKRRAFLGAFLSSAVLSTASTAQNKQAPEQTQTTVKVSKITPLANDFVKVYESPDPANVYAYSPGLTILPSGRLVATMDQGGKGVKDLPDLRKEGKHLWKGKIFTSDDHGKTWTERAATPFSHARPVVAGKALYIVGKTPDLGVMRSEDDGMTWSEPSPLTEKQQWHQAPCNVCYSNGRVYLVMERITKDVNHWPVSALAPVVMSANVNDDLLDKKSWKFSNEFTYQDAVAQAGVPNLIGVPFFKEGPTDLRDLRNMRNMAPPGWLETNIVQFKDPAHVWFDPNGKTFHLWMRAHTGGTNLAAILKAIEDDKGDITVGLENAPSGAPMLYVPCPGGQMKFHILHDDESNLFWLLSSQSTDSMTRPTMLPKERYNLPNNERHRLALHFSRNCVDWCFAGLVTDTGHPEQSRNYASMVIDGADLHILSRSGDERAKNAHDGNLITFHTVKDFRDLIY
jgi:hypothetical protein